MTEAKNDSFFIWFYKITKENEKWKNSQIINIKKKLNN